MIMDKKLIIRMQLVEEITLIPSDYPETKKITAERELGRAETFTNDGIAKAFDTVPLLASVLRRKL